MRNEWVENKSRTMRLSIYSIRIIPSASPQKCGKYDVFILRRFKTMNECERPEGKERERLRIKWFKFVFIVQTQNISTGCIFYGIYFITTVTEAAAASVVTREEYLPIRLHFLHLKFTTYSWDICAHIHHICMHERTLHAILSLNIRMRCTK